MGTPADDVICGLGGDDTISGKGGDDRLLGGTGNDELKGGPGNDVLQGAAGSDTLEGSQADDTLAGGGGADELVGGAGSDALNGGGSDDRVAGGDGSDLAKGAGGEDVILGQDDNDEMFGGTGSDTLLGGAGDDTLQGGPDPDTFNGGPGLDGCLTLPDETQIACEDVTPPKLVELTFEPRTIDTSSEEQTIEATVHIRDDLSGMGPGLNDTLGWLMFERPTGDDSVNGSFYNWNMVSGDHHDGWWRTTITFDQYSDQGTWTARVVLFDDVGNKTELDHQELAAAGFPSTLEQVGPGDNSVPELTDIRLTPETIDTSSGSQTITVEFDMTDDVSGFAWGVLDFHSPNDDQRARAQFDESHLIAGDALNGTYRTTMTLPQFSEPGTWELEHIMYSDHAENIERRYTDDIVETNMARRFEQTGAGDSQAPELLEFDFTPKVVDTSDGDVTITFAARISDDLVGFKGGFIRFENPNGRDFPHLNGGFEYYQLTSGDLNNGTYESTATLPRFSARGEWHLRSLTLFDDLGNRVDLSESDLQLMGFPTVFVNTALS